MGHTAEDQGFEKAIVAAYPRLLRYARQLTRNAADAGDLVHDTIERGLSCRGRFECGTAADRWLSTILRRLFIDRCRHAQVEERAGRLGHNLEVAVEAECAREDAGASPIDLWQLFTTEDVRRASGLLAPCLRSAYVMFTFEQRSYVQIAALLSIPTRTVATRVSRARKRLRRLLLTRELASQTARNDNGDGHDAQDAYDAHEARALTPAVAPRRKAAKASRPSETRRAA